VTIYIALTPELAKQDKASTPLLLKSSSDSESKNVDSQLTSLTIVDPNVPKFLVHKNLICYYSPLFSAAFNGNFIEGTTQSMTLDVDKVGFGVWQTGFIAR
jgi:hypothetical protein